MTRIMLNCTVGKDLTDKQVDYWENGILKKKDVSFALRTAFQTAINRSAAPHVTLFPFLAHVFISLSERDLLANC
jgi:hypothetical protein